MLILILIYKQNFDRSLIAILLLNYSVRHRKSLEQHIKHTEYVYGIN